MSSNLDVGPFGGGNTAVFQDVRANGINGQTLSIQGEVIEFNTEVIGKNFVSLSSNQFTLEAGAYQITFSAVLNASASRDGQIYLYDTVGLVSVGGIRITSDGVDLDQVTESEHSFFLKISSSKILELRIACSASYSFSQIDSFYGDSEYYQQLIITKIG